MAGSYLSDSSLDVEEKKAMQQVAWDKEAPDKEVGSASARHHGLRALLKEVVMALIIRIWFRRFLIPVYRLPVRSVRVWHYGKRASTAIAAIENIMLRKPKLSASSLKSRPLADHRLVDTTTEWNIGCACYAYAYRKLGSRPEPRDKEDGTSTSAQVHKRTYCTTCCYMRLRAGRNR